MAATSEKSSITVLEVKQDDSKYKVNSVCTISANNIKRLRDAWEKQQYEDNCYYTVKTLLLDDGVAIFAFYFRVKLDREKRSHCTLKDTWFCFHSLDMLERFIIETVSPFLPFHVDPNADAETIKSLIELAQSIDPIHNALTVMHEMGFIKYEPTQ